MTCSKATIQPLIDWIYQPSGNPLLFHVVTGTLKQYEEGMARYVWSGRMKYVPVSITGWNREFPSGYFHGNLVDYNNIGVRRASVYIYKNKLDTEIDIVNGYNMTAVTLTKNIACDWFANGDFIIQGDDNDLTHYVLALRKSVFALHFMRLGTLEASETPDSGHPVSVEVEEPASG